MDQVGDRLVGQEDHLLVAVRDDGRIIRIDEHHLGHAALDISIGRHVLGSGGSDLGSILDAGVDGVIIVINVVDHEDGLGVGLNVLSTSGIACSHALAAGLIDGVELGLSHLNAGLIAGQVEVTIHTLVLGLRGAFIGRRSSSSTKGTGSNGLSHGLQGVNAVVFLVGDNGAQLQLIGIALVILGSFNNLLGAVSEDEHSLVGVEVGLVLIVNQQSVVADLLDFLNIDGIAISIQIDIVLVANAGIIQLHAIGLVGELVSGVLDVDSLVGIPNLGLVLNAGSLAGDGLSNLNGLDLLGILGVGVQNISVIIEGSGGLELLAVLHAGGLLTLGDHNNISILLGGSLDGLGNLADIGVDLGDGDGISIVIIEDLGQNAVGAIAVIIVILGDSDGDDLVLGINNAVHIDGNVLLLDLGAQAQILVDVADINGLGVGQVSGVSVGADLLSLQLPHVGGTSEIVGALGDGQVVEILLGELHLAVSLEDLTVGLAGVDHVLSRGLILDGDVADGDGGVLLILDHGSGQSVQSVQASLLAVDSLDTVEIAHQIIVQADVQSALGNVDGPVGASVAFLSGIIAQSAQQHLHEGIAGQGVGGTEGAVSVTGDDAFLLAISDIASEGVVGGDVLVRSGVSNQSRCGGGAKDQVADDLGSSATGQGGGGTEVTFGIAVDDLHGGHHVDSFSVLDLGAVGEVLGTGRDGDQRHGHHQSQYQRKELLHGVSSLIKCRNIALELPAPGFRVSCRG